MAAGANLAVLGSEIIQFGDAVPLGEGGFRLTRLLRGRRGTEWATGDHLAGEHFVMLDRSRLQLLPVSSAQVGAVVSAIPLGLADTDAEPTQLVVSGEALRPPSPARLRARFDAAGNLDCSWTRRSSLGWDWLDGVDAPLGCATERYRISLRGTAAAIDLETSTPEARFTADQVAALGPGDLELSIVQLGDLAASRPASLTVTIS